MAPGRPRFYELVVANWPLKLTALAFAAIVWAAVAAEEPTIQRVAISLRVRAPEGRPLTRSLPPVYGIFAGPARELLKLLASPPVIRVAIPDSTMDSVYTVTLAAKDIEVAKHVDVRAESVEPAIITLTLKDVARHTLPVVPPVTVHPDSGFAERVLMGIPVTVRGERGSGGWSSEPPAVIVTVRGPPARLVRLTRDSVEVTALAAGTGRPETVRLEVVAPAGVDASITPDTAVVQRRNRG